MSHCPCCDYSLLRHVKMGKVYWFCPHCWQTMPNFEKRANKITYYNELEGIVLKPQQVYKEKVSSTVTV